ncbi:PREDICTED: protein apterous-like [Nicrophorus vespilloides]|uniref:Protein apterous-like n=1 Tax=Nicrophorus vespilloides TaxID=110193 RepID=A0ABM1MZR3_NICVS|nr:PREDICTED: protein apterous-like [Nicrophorus vespilloides]
MGVFEEAASRTPGMHWQQHEQYLGPAYDPSRDLSPNLPSCDSSMGDAEPSISSGSSCSTPSNNNHHQSSCASDICSRPGGGVGSGGGVIGGVGSVVGQTTELCGSQLSASFEHIHIPKLEPLQDPPSTPPTPPTPPIHPDDPTVCAGCCLRITDRFYLQAVDRRWHASCLQCCQCNPKSAVLNVLKFWTVLVQ